MTCLLLLVARRAVATLFPSVPLRDQDRVAAAMEHPYPMTPTTGFEGEARLVAGHGPVDETDSPLVVSSTGTDQVGRHGVMPACEEVVDWRPEPGNRYVLSDRRLAATVAAWAKAAR